MRRAIHEAKCAGRAPTQATGFPRTATSGTAASARTTARLATIHAGRTRAARAEYTVCKVRLEPNHVAETINSQHRN